MAEPKIVVLCGSSRFVDIMAVCAWLIERDEGAIVMGLHLLPWWYSAELVADHLAEYEGVAAALDELHFRKIELADEVFVVNHGDYIGESTRREVEHARRLMPPKPLRWFTQDPIGADVLRRLETARAAVPGSPDG